MDFEQLRIFMVLAEEGTFLGAANRLATSRSRVRRKLDQLEAAAGTALLLRDQGSLRPTRAGEVLVARGSVLLAAADQLIRSVHDVGVEPSGRLRIALPIGRPPDGWSRACHALQTHYPDLEIETYSSARPTDLLPSPAEIALTFDDEIPGGCHGVAVGEFPMRLLASETYLARHGHPEKPEDHQAGSFFDADGNGQWSNAVKLDPERIFDHAKHVESNAACTDCHAAVVTGAMIPVGSRLTMQECMSCHEQKAPDYNDCSTCHKELREDTRPKSHLAGWDRAHGRAAIAGDFDDLPRDCALCHQQKSFCDDCHRAEMPRDHTNAFRMHGHAARASIDRDRCETCHTTDSCSECHKDAMPRSHRAVWGEPFNRHCNGCHLPVQSFGEVGCAVCHEDTPSHATAPMRPGNPIHQTNDPNQCRECHTPMEHPDNGQSCLLCHQ